MQFNRLRYQSLSLLKRIACRRAHGQIRHIRRVPFPVAPLEYDPVSPQPIIPASADPFSKPPYKLVVLRLGLPAGPPSIFSKVENASHMTAR